LLVDKDVVPLLMLWYAFEERPLQSMTYFVSKRRDQMSNRGLEVSFAKGKSFI
jgi:hypothetical protein